MSRLRPEAYLAWAERDNSVARWMHGASTRDWVVHVLGAVSRIGDGWVWYLVILALPWFDRESGTACAIRMAIVGGVDLTVYLIIKRWIARPRPCRALPGIRACSRPLDEYSFPSGHTLHSVAFSLIITVYYPVLAVVVWPFTLLLALSRIVLGLHYPSDVIVGAVIGALMAGISFNLL
jgi:undecaprenyl-diphosphatase